MGMTHKEKDTILALMRQDKIYAEESALAAIRDLRRCKQSLCNERAMNREMVKENRYIREQLKEALKL